MTMGGFIAILLEPCLFKIVERPYSSNRTAENTCSYINTNNVYDLHVIYKVPCSANVVTVVTRYLFTAGCAMTRQVCRCLHFNLWCMFLSQR